MSLRLRLTLLCAVLLTLCCLLLTLTNNLSAIQMADAMQAVPVLPAQDAAAGATASLPMMELEASETVRQAREIFHLQSLLAMAAVLAAGLFLIYRLVGKALDPLDELAPPDPGAHSGGSGPAPGRPGQRGRGGRAGPRVQPDVPAAESGLCDAEEFLPQRSP